MGSSWTRDWTPVPCIGRRVLNHWNSREKRLLFHFLSANYHPLNWFLHIIARLYFECWVFNELWPKWARRIKGIRCRLSDVEGIATLPLTCLRPSEGPATIHSLGTRPSVNEPCWAWKGWMAVPHLPLILRPVVLFLSLWFQPMRSCKRECVFC